MPRRSAVLVLFVVAAVALLIGATLWRFTAGRLAYAPAPASAVLGVPDRPLRVVSYNILHNHRGVDGIIREIERLRPDFVLLQEVESRDVDEMARRLGMSTAHEGRVYYASQNLGGRRASWGNSILSKHPLYEAQSIPNPGGGSFGVWAVSVVEDRKFHVACVHLSATWKASPTHMQQQADHRHKELTNLVRAWDAMKRPPIVVGGDFNQLPLGNNYFVMTEHWTDALASIKRTDNTFKAGLLRTRIDYLLVSREWTVCDGGVVTSDASDHRPAWVQLQGRDGASADPTR